MQFLKINLTKENHLHNEPFKCSSLINNNLSKP